MVIVVTQPPPKARLTVDRLLNKALRAFSFGGGCVLLIAVPYSEESKKVENSRQQLFTQPCVRLIILMEFIYF